MQAITPEDLISPTQIQITNRPKEAEGWRQGRPIEDPEKTKRWGYVRAQPSEFLVHVRKGQVRSVSSGQGATCWKWPWDSVAVIPTSLQQLRFRADQVTLEKVGIEVIGLAVYRIADPLIAYRVLNFSFPERAQEKLEETLTSMFVGAARRLIANLSLDECLQKRKSSLAVELMHEVSPVVAGEGRPEDVTKQGWGIVIDTIEVQEVRVLSKAVFAQMQAPFRAALDRQARESRAEADKEIATREAACKQAIDEARLQSAWVVAERKRELAAQELEIKREEQVKRSRVERELAEMKLVDQAAVEQKKAELVLKAQEAETQRRIRAEELRLQKTRAEQQLAAQSLELKREEEVLRARYERELGELKLIEHAALEQKKAELWLSGQEAETQRRMRAEELRLQEAKAELETFTVIAEAATKKAELERAALALQIEKRQQEADIQRREGEGVAAVAMEQARVEAALYEAKTKLKVAERLPDLAHAVGSKIGEVRVTQVGGDAAGAFGAVTGAVQSILELARNV